MNDPIWINKNIIICQMAKNKFLEMRDFQKSTALFYGKLPIIDRSRFINNLFYKRTEIRANAQQPFGKIKH